MPDERKDHENKYWDDVKQMLVGWSIVLRLPFMMAGFLRNEGKSWLSVVVTLAASILYAVVGFFAVTFRIWPFLIMVLIGIVLMALITAIVNRYR